MSAAHRGLDNRIRPLCSPASVSPLLTALFVVLLAPALLTPTAGGQTSDDQLEILSINPSGEDVPAARQIVLQFDRPMVPVGRMERRPDEVPISIEPALECEWRWLDTSALACQLGDETTLVPATRYRLTVGLGLVARDGATLGEAVRHEFVTQRPGISRTYFRTWRGPGSPEILVNINQPVSLASLERHLFFATPDGRRFPLHVEAAEPSSPQPQQLNLVVRPIDELPLDTAMHLRVEPGLESLRGPERSSEDKTVVEFYTFPEFRFVGVHCTDNLGNKVRIPAGGAQGADCNPLQRVSLLFSTPVIHEVLRDHLIVEPDLAGGRDDYDPWENLYSYSRLRRPRREGQEYWSRLPEVLKARSTYQLSAAAESIRDEFDRPLPLDIDLSFRTDDRPPRAVITHALSVLERQAETHLPVYVTNLDRLEVSGRRLRPSGVDSLDLTVPVPPEPNVAFAYPLEVRRWLGGESGAVFGRADPIPPMPEEPSPLFFSQVTPFQVHVKLGHLNTSVWVTDLATGLPVPDARVRIYVDALSLPAEPKTLSEATTNEIGLAMLDGSASLDPELDYDDWLYLRHPRSVLFVRVDRDGEMALVPLAGNFQVRSEGPNNSWIPTWARRRHGHIKTWGTTAQGVYRVGDRLQYKIYVRDQDNRRLIAAPRHGYTLEVTDPMGKTVHQRDDISLNVFGAVDGEFKIPESGAVGWYSFGLRGDFTDDFRWSPMDVLVADFTPAPFRVTTDLNGELFHPEEEVSVGTAARLHSGGPYTEAQTRITATLRSQPLRTDNPAAQSFYFQTGSSRTETMHQSESRVDGGGDLETGFQLGATSILHGRLAVESAVRDDRGKYVSGRASARYVGRDRFVGIRIEDWLLDAGEPASVQAVVLDDLDATVEGVEITTRVEYRETRASRVKGAGNAYLTQYVHTWVDAGGCTQPSELDATACAFTPEHPGLYRMTVSVLDTQGRSHASTTQRWALGPGRVLWETPPGHHLPVEPEESSYEVGDTARFLVRNPFPGAVALFTVERLGVQTSWTRTLDNSTELVELEITPDHLPGFYFSCVVTSPRVEVPGETGEVDLGKPAFRMGYVRVPVTDPYKEIDVSVHTDLDTYRPRDRVTVDFEARPRHPSSAEPQPRIELAVAVLDESVFDLLSSGRDTFDPYKGFYDLEALDLRNFNLLTHLIGIQKFEKKGANPGGGGGGAGPDLRSVFKFVSYWNPSIETDEDGRATIEFQVPDNLTGWRVLALAVTPGDLMGLGEDTFVVNQPIELRPALPNQLTEGDAFDARFTVMNRTTETRTLKINARVEGPARSPGIETLSLTAEPYKRYTLDFPVQTTAAGMLSLTVAAASDIDRDALLLPLVVKRRAVLEAAASYGTTTENEVTEEIAFPDNMRDDVGRVSVVASPSVIGGVDGAFRYLRDYPYLCWEQRLSKGVMASHYTELRAYLPAELEWPEAAELPQAMLESAADFQAPNGGMVYWIPEDRYVSPYLSAYTALAFQWLRERGHDVPPATEARLHGYLQQLLRTDVFPGFYSRGMASSVRAVALAALAPSGKIDRADLERYRRHLLEMDLFGRAHYLEAATVLGVDDLEREIERSIMAHANQTGGKFVFSETVDTSYSRILHSAPRSQCAVLSALVEAQGGAPTSATGLGDVPFKLTRSITQERKQRDRWQNTQENVFCMNALIDFSKAYERDTPDMTVRVFVDDKRIGKARFESVRDEPADLDRPIQERDPGREATVRITREGQGRLYYATRLFYSPARLKTEPVNSGIEVKREYSVEREGEWVLLESPMAIEQGELVRVDLYVSLPAARNFVVVDDPVPGGLEPVNRDLATASTVDADKGEFQRSDLSWWFSRDDWRSFGYSRWSFYHRELRHDSARFYSDYLPAGNYHLSYVAQAIAPGGFQVLPLHVEEMYDPDVFGQGVPAALKVAGEHGGGSR